MTRRHDEGTYPDSGHGEFEAIQSTDAFLDALARGEDPSGGEDPLASALLGMRAEVNAQMPPAPTLAELGLVEGVASISRERRKRRTFLPSRTTRSRKTQKSHPFVHGMIGAAAATLVIAGGGAAVYNATPGSSLYPLSEHLFSDRKAIVELAGTLGELDDRATEGDIAGTRALVEQMRAVLKHAPRLGNSNPVTTTRTLPPAPPSTEVLTETTTVTEPTTEVQVATETVTVTVVPTSPSPSPSTTPTTPPEGSPVPPEEGGPGAPQEPQPAPPAAEQPAPPAPGE